MFNTLKRIVVKNEAIKSFVGIGRQQCRQLNIHENEAYTLVKSVGIPTPEFGVAKTPEEAEKIAQGLNSKDLVVKAQVLAGGRGKGRFKGSNVGGVVMCDTPEEAKNLASKMLGKKLVTKQTGETGRICNAVMITTRMFNRKELYLSVMMERTFNGPVIISSREGGVDIEEVAARNPDAIMYTPVNIFEGLSSDCAQSIACSLGVDQPEIIADIVCKLYDLFVQKDALLLEINPLAQDICGNYYAIDCKCNFDDSSEFRQKELFAMQDWTQRDIREAKAAKYDQTYIALDGNIGCMVNGAGLAMATMDIIKLHGGEPANFLDIGGSSTVESVTEAFKIITSDPKVETIFVNIFAGINRCDIVAEGIITAFKNLNLNTPVVVRLQGTNADKGRQLITEAQLKIIAIDDMSRAAEACVSIAEIVRLARSLNLDIQLTPKKDEKADCR